MKWEVLDPANSEPLIVQTEDGTQAFQFNPDGSVETPSFSTDHTQTKSIEYDRSQSYPNWPNQPARSGAPKLKPYPGVTNPIVTPDEVIEIAAEMVADPFWVYEQETGKVHIFAEAMDRTNTEVLIGHWEGPDPTGPFTYQEATFGPFDYSTEDVSNYSYVWRDGYDGEWYIQDNGGSGGNRIQRFNDFPNPDFTEVGEGLPGGDPNIIDWNNRKWLISHDASKDPEEKYLYYGQDGVLDIDQVSWNAHPANPIVQSNILGKNGGRPIVDRDGIYVPCRGGSPSRVSMIRLTELTTSSVQWNEVETSPVLRAGDVGRWATEGVHHMDTMLSDKFGTPAVLVDGIGGPNADWRLGVMTWATGEDNRLDTLQRTPPGAVVMEPQWDSLTRWDQFTSGGSINTPNATRVELVANTSGDRVKLAMGRNSNAAFNRISMDVDSRFIVGIELQNSAADREEYHTIGSIGEGGNQGYGFKIANDTLYGVVHDGTGETTTAIQSTPSGRFRLMAEHFAGNRVEFYAGEPSLGGADATITSGLPSGIQNWAFEHYLGATTTNNEETWMSEPPRYYQAENAQ